MLQKEQTFDLSSENDQRALMRESTRTTLEAGTSNNPKNHCDKHRKYKPFRAPITARSENLWTRIRAVHNRERIDFASFFLIESSLPTLYTSREETTVVEMLGNDL